MGVSLEQDADRDQHEDSESEAASSNGEDEEGRGLEAFEDVLSSWLTAAHSKTSQALVKAQASLPLRPRTAGGGGQSTLARIQEQQQQLTKEEAQAGITENSQNQRASASKKKRTGDKKSAQQAGMSATAGGESAEVAEEGEEEPDSPTGIEGWKDVLSNWMTTAGVAAPAQRAQQAASKPAADSGGKGTIQPNSQPAKTAEQPSWLADVSSDEEAEEEGASNEVTAPRTSSISEAQLKTAVSHELSSEAGMQGAAGFSAAQQQQPQLAQHGTISNAAAAGYPPSPLQGYSMPIQNLMSSSGISSQDLRFDGDLLGRARSDPAALWANSASGFPPRAGQELQLPPPVATSMPAPVYPADQGLPAQVSSIIVLALQQGFTQTVFCDFFICLKESMIPPCSALWHSLASPCAVLTSSCCSSDKITWCLQWLSATLQVTITNHKSTCCSTLIDH